MKNKLFLIVTVLTLTLIACNSDDGTSNSQVNLKFTHSWNDTEVTNVDFNIIKFENANGEQLSIERLRYLISKITLTNENGETNIMNDYKLIDVTNNENLSFDLPEKITNGTYTLSFIFGFNNEDNQDGIYTELNSVSWNVPGMLGGGYHYMQFDGKYTSSIATDPQNFNYHVIRAVDRTDADNLRFQDTFFTVNLGNIEISEDTTVAIKMNIAEWFENPNTWDLNELNTVLMPNFDAQLLMNENGQNVFSLDDLNN